MFQNLYLHVPFCRSKCAYCAFYSVPVQADMTEAVRPWLDRMKQQLSSHQADLQELHTVYIGGGTPTSLPDPLLSEFLQTIHQFCRLIPGAEISMESNPETVTPSKAAIAAQYVNRISMGVQSFQKRLLQSIGRHCADPDTVEYALNCYRSAGISNIGFDLMYALPGQSLSDFQTDLTHAFDLGIRHLSAYSLTVEEGTPLARTGYDPDDDLSQDMWTMAGEYAAAAGLPRYEISNYAAGPFEAHHNQNVWHGETYLGLGPSACSFDGWKRWTEQPSLMSWLNGTPPDPDEILREQRMREIFLMGLRSVRGWAPGEFAKAVHGDGDWHSWQKELAPLFEAGLLELFDRDGIRPTLQGLTYWNEIGLALL